MLTKEDIDIIREIVDNGIENVRKMETEKLNNEFRTIVNRTVKWYSDNATKNKIIDMKKSTKDILNEEAINYRVEEVKELRTMYIDIVELLKYMEK